MDFGPGTPRAVKSVIFRTIVMIMRLLSKSLLLDCNSNYQLEFE